MLYHKDTGIPANLQVPSGILSLHYGEHAIRAANDDRYCRVPLPRSMNTRNATVIEVEAIQGTVVKTVYRVPINAYSDACYVIVPDGSRPGSFFVKTVWINTANDTHRTLHTSRYARA